MQIPKTLSKLIEHFERLPGIGPKTAQRLVFNLLHFPDSEIQRFASDLQKFKQDIRICSICKNVGDTDPCAICEDTSRNRNLIALVANPMDVFALEKAGFKGVYHVLHGVIDPLNNIGPEELFVHDLITRLRSMDVMYGDKSVEIILATNTSMEGESTAMYIARLIKENGFDESCVKLTRLARGIPVGGDIEYADDVTLSRALEGRTNF